MINRHILNELGAINSITVLNESRVALCSKLDLYSKAIIYDFDQHKVVAEYKSEKNCQLVFYRTDKEDLFIYFNQGQKIPEEAEDSSDDEAVSKDPLMDSKAITALKRIFFHIPEEPVFLMNAKTLTPEAKNVEWAADDAISIGIGEEGFFIDRPWRSSIEEKNFAQATAIQYDFNAVLKPIGENHLFRISYNKFDEMNAAESDLPLFCIDSMIKPHNDSQDESKSGASVLRGLFISGCSIGNDEDLIIGYHTPYFEQMRGDSEKTKPFMIGVWDGQSPEAFKKYIQLDHVIEKLLYLPEKELIIGLVRHDSPQFYIFDKSLKHQIINTNKSIADIAIFDQGNNKIAFMDGTVNDLEMYINPDYHEKYHNEIKETLDNENIPAVLIPIITDYAGSKNCFSLFNTPKQIPNEIEAAPLYSSASCRML